MSEKTISYLTNTYEDYKSAIIDKSQKYYPDIFSDFNDASIGTWLIDVMADISDTLRYNIDRCYQETGIDSANTRESLNQIARTSGLNIPGPKCAIVEIEISCTIPMNNSADVTSGNNLSVPDENYCPYIKRGTMFSNGSQSFELIDDIDFANQFDYNGIGNRQIIPNRDGNGNIINYTYKKLAMARAGYTKIYKKIINNADLEPYMNITLNDTNICNVESIIVKQGTSLGADPNISEFYVDDESYVDKTGKPVLRYFEVKSLAEPYRFGYEIDQTTDGYYDPVWQVVDEFDLVDENGDQVVDDNGNPITEVVRLAMKGKWKRLKNKFLTEFTDANSLKITFGPGIRNSYGDIPDDAQAFTKYMMARMEANDYLGVLPEPNTTMYILYRVGGGEETNVGPHTINTITYINMDIPGNCDDVNDSKKKSSVRNTLRVDNPTASYGGKDAPSNEELKYLIKYNSATQDRCVTLKDYYAKILQIHPKYGCPYRHSVVEENNKVVIYTLGLDLNGKLMTQLSEPVAENIKEYLSEYKCVNDFVEIRSGHVINVGFEVNIYVDKAYDRSEVIKRVIDTITDYMDIRKHIMGEDIFLGDLEKEISKLDGVTNLIALRCVNKVGEGYSEDEINQSTVDQTTCEAVNRAETLGSSIDSPEIDLDASDKTLYGSIDSMFEIKYPNKDIRVRVKTR